MPAPSDVRPGSPPGASWYAREHRERELASTQVQTSLAQARLQALRTQLNPHFLFNTLNATSVVALNGQGEAVAHTLTLLSEMLRLSLDSTLPQEIPVARELEFVDRYLEIQRVRFPDRLSVAHRIDPEALDPLIPSLLLQPIVENAVMRSTRRTGARVVPYSRGATMDGSVRALIADDEPLAREGIRLHLARHPDVVIAGEAGDGDEAVALIEELKPDLVFLDVQMPALDGFGVLESIADRHLPVVVFVTAYDKYAIRAFDLHAFDYLLKPFPAARFDQALRRARDEIASRGSHANRRRLLELLASRTLESPYVTRFVVRQGERHLLVKAADVHSFEANGNYIRLRTDRGSFMVRMTMAELEKKLDPARFARIHRSTVVNVDRIKDIKPAWHGDFEVQLADGHRVRLSRNFRERLLP